MKKLLLIIVLSIACVNIFAQARVLTQQEKDSLKNDPVFKLQCEWAVREFASYWSLQTGVSCATEVECIAWAKNRLLSIHVLTKGVPQMNISLTEVFLNAGKGKELAYGANPTTLEITQLWLSAPNEFEEFAAEFFKVWGNDVDMSVGN